MQFSVIFLTIIVYSVEILCENKSNNKSLLENQLGLIGYIHGYKIGQDAALQYPGLLVSPVIVVPVLNAGRKNNIQTNSKKTIRNKSTAEGIVLTDKNDIEVSFRQTLERGSVYKKDLRQVKTNESPKQMDNTTGVKNVTDSEVTTLKASTLENNVTYETTTDFQHTDTTIHGPYPNAIYNNQVINSLSITIKSPDDILYPPLAGERWKNFTLSTNISLKDNTTKENPSDSLNITGYPSVNETDSSIKGVYPAAIYNNTEIDQLSITTNSYTNTSPLPPPQDDRWSSFASLRKISPTSNEFRPLAGLYYDGFLHKPILKTQGFVPYNHYTSRTLF